MARTHLYVPMRRTATVHAALYLWAGWVADRLRATRTQDPFLFKFQSLLHFPLHFLHLFCLFLSLFPSLFLLLFLSLFMSQPSHNSNSNSNKVLFQFQDRVQVPWRRPGLRSLPVREPGMGPVQGPGLWVWVRVFWDGLVWEAELHWMEMTWGIFCVCGVFFIVLLDLLV